MDNARYEAALGDLSHDADSWEALGALFEKLRGTVDSCALARYEMDGMGHLAGAEDLYNEAQAKIFGLVSGGATTMTEIGENLRATRRNYESADGHARWLLDQG